MGDDASIVALCAPPMYKTAGTVPRLALPTVYYWRTATARNDYF